MILISELREYVAAKKEQLPLVNFTKIVVKQDEVVDFLSDIKAADNQIMMAIIPDAKSSGKDEDSVKMNNALAFLFLEKTEYAVSKQEEWLAVFERTQETGIAFMNLLIEEINEGSCEFNRYLDIKNITIEPISGLASCNGWTVEVYFDIPF